MGGGDLVPTWEALGVQALQTEALQQLVLGRSGSSAQQRQQRGGQSEDGQEDIVVCPAGDCTVQPGREVCVPIGQILQRGGLAGGKQQEADQ